MSRFRIEKLPKTQDAAILAYQARHMRKLRLDSLKTDPSRFFSQYADEVNQPLQFSIDRLSGKDAHHWIVVDQEHNLQDRDPEAPEAWVGFLVVIAADNVNNRADLHEPEPSADRVGDFHMGAAWVDPAHRKKGLCSSMMKDALAWVKQRVDAEKMSKAHVDLGVRVGNEAAIQLYHKLGFSKWKQKTEKATNGEEYVMDWMKCEILPTTFQV